MKATLTILYVLATLLFIGVITWRGKFNAPSFALLLFVVCLTALLFYNIDQIQRFVFKAKDTELSAELKSIKEDIYAKVEDVKRMGEEIGRIAAYSAMEANRLVGDDHVDQLVARRDSIVSMLEDFGADADKISQIADYMDQWIIHDLQYELAEVAPTLSIDIQPGKNDEEIQKFLAEASESEIPVARAVKRLYTFMRNKKLPKE